MKSSSKAIMTALLIGAVGLTGPALGEEFLMHARMSFDEGGAMVKGPETSDWSQATINTLVLPGDTLWVDRGGTAEVEFSGGSFLRMADGSKAEVVSLPPNGTIRGWQGSFYVHRLARSQADFTFQTPACTIVVEPDTTLRVDIIDAGATTVSVRWGRATVRTDLGGATIASMGQRVWADPGMLPSDPLPFDRSTEDAFDAWNRGRTELLVRGVTTIPKAVRVAAPTIGYSALASTGEWVYVDSRPYWRPTVVVDYVPYHRGHWSYVSGVGHTWVGGHSFSYVTSHYGRWCHNPAYGWLWSYDPVWSPAWVASVRCGDYHVWSPIDYYHRPVLVRDSAYFSIGGVRFGISSTSYVAHGNLYFGARHVAPCTPAVVSLVTHRPADINIWNINTGARNHVRVPYTAHMAPRVRNYNPTRSIRGPSIYDGRTASASARVRTLERGIGRSTFVSAKRPTGTATVRTVSSGQGRTARVRSVSLDRDHTRVQREVRSGSGATTARSTLASAGHSSATVSRSVRSGTKAPSASTRSSAPSGTTRVSSARTPSSTATARSVRSATPSRSTASSTPSRTKVPSSVSRSRLATVDMDRTPTTQFDRGGTTTRNAPVRSSKPSTAKPVTRTQPRTTSASRGTSRSVRSSSTPAAPTVSRTAPRSTPPSSRPSTTSAMPRVGRSSTPSVSGSLSSAGSSRTMRSSKPAPTVRTVPRPSGPSVSRSSRPSVPRASSPSPSVSRSSRPPVPRASSPSVSRSSRPSVPRASSPSVSRSSRPSVSRSSSPSVSRSSRPSVSRSAAPSVSRSSRPSVSRSSSPSASRSMMPVVPQSSSSRGSVRSSGSTSRSSRSSSRTR